MKVDQRRSRPDSIPNLNPRPCLYKVYSRHAAPKVVTRNWTFPADGRPCSRTSEYSPHRWNSSNLKTNTSTSPRSQVFGVAEPELETLVLGHGLLGLSLTSITSGLWRGRAWPRHPCPGLQHLRPPTYFGNIRLLLLETTISSSPRSQVCDMAEPDLETLVLGYGIFSFPLTSVTSGYFCLRLHLSLPMNPDVAPTRLPFVLTPRSSLEADHSAKPNQ